ncbi:hypothetical protein BH10PSE17_BH10PSE17_10520 [soil metagenome]
MPTDVASIRRTNALFLFDEFVRNTVADPDAATLRGLDRRFAERLQIQPSYWSQIKSRARHIGERLARQFESLSNKPIGWMDEPHDQPASVPEGLRAADDDERFVVGLVLSYYRRDPARARQRLLELIGEALVTGDAKPTKSSAAAPAATRSKPASAERLAELASAQHARLRIVKKT